MPDADTLLGQGLIDERNEGRRNAYRGFGTRFEPKRTGYPTRACPTCGKSHAAYALFPPACQYPGDSYTYHVDGKPA